MANSLLYLQPSTLCELHKNVHHFPWRWRGIKKKQIALQSVELERISQQMEDLWYVRNFSFLPSRVFFWIYLLRCNPFPFHHYVIYNLNLWDKTLVLPGEQLESSIPFAIENIDVWNVLCLTRSVESIPIFSDKYPSAYNIYSSVFISLQIIDSPSERNEFSAEAAPPVWFSQPLNKHSKMEDFTGLMDKKKEAVAVKHRGKKSPQNWVVMVNIAPQWQVYMTFIASMKRLLRHFHLYFIDQAAPHSFLHNCAL